MNEEQLPPIDSQNTDGKQLEEYPQKHRESDFEAWSEDLEKDLSFLEDFDTNKELQKEWGKGFLISQILETRGDLIAMAEKVENKPNFNLFLSRVESLLKANDDYADELLGELTPEKIVEEFRLIQAILARGGPGSIEEHESGRLSELNALRFIYDGAIHMWPEQKTKFQPIQDAILECDAIIRANKDSFSADPFVKSYEDRFNTHLIRE